MSIRLAVIFILLSAILVRTEYRSQPLNTEKWAELTEDLDYSEDPPEPVEINETQSPFLEFLGDVLTVLPYIALTLLVGFIAYYLISRYKGPEKKLEKIKSEISAAEENPVDADLEELLKQAEKTGDTRVILRIYYLMIIKALTLKKHIRHAPQKTNRDYLYEIKNPEIKLRFTDLTYAFDRIWYGGYTLPRDEFDKRKNQSLKLLESLNTKVR